MKKTEFAARVKNDWENIGELQWERWLNPRHPDDLDSFKDLIIKSHIFDRKCHCGKDFSFTWENKGKRNAEGIYSAARLKQKCTKHGGTYALNFFPMSYDKNYLRP